MSFTGTTPHTTSMFAYSQIKSCYEGPQEQQWEIQFVMVTAKLKPCNTASKGIRDTVKFLTGTLGWDIAQ